MRKRSPTVSGGRQLNCAMVVVRLAPPSSSPSPSQQPTLVASSRTSDYDTRSISSEDTLGQLDEDIGGLASPTTSSVGEDTGLLEEYHKLETAENTLRRRRKRKSPKLKPYCVGTTDEETDEGDSESDCPPSTPDHDEPHHHHHHFSIVDGEEEGGSITLDEISRITFTTLCNNEEDDGWEDVCISHRSAIVPPPQHMSRAELILDTFSPYRELSHPRCDFSKLLTRLLSEWYAIGGCLLATATLNAAVFGYSSGSTTLFSLDSTALRSVTIGSIASGIGLVIDAWFLILYSSSSVDRFRRLAADVFPSSTEPEYPTYVYFSVTCRLPAVCLFVAACALMVFLLNVAWMAWPVAVLVMCFVAGVLVTLQYLVFGVRRVVGGVVWVGRRVWGGVGRKRKQKNKLRVPPFVGGGGEPGLSPGGCERSDSLPPPPYSSPQIPVQKLDDATSTSNTAEHEDDEPGIELGPSISRRPDV
ncbi:hypothetical protein BDY19DRAFT_988042 [Irpex rosettiformis]|uniref:Uncharacterized protein n=1 Tax=Irpex rosettiformis TaxID=378272 RepID=A0ACB8UKD8_9APHY|nr:hypothetical protein BDY19DRAFT_988042 [Irpex rosettiformis]